MAPEIPQTRWAKTVDGLGVPSLRSARVLPLGQARSEFLNPSGLHSHVATLEQHHRDHEQRRRRRHQHHHSHGVEALPQRRGAARVVKQRKEPEGPAIAIHLGSVFSRYMATPPRRRRRCRCGGARWRRSRRT